MKCCGFVWTLCISHLVFKSVNFDVILACSPGEYGRNCQFRCREQCYDNEVCDPFFGNCSKCADGFKSAKCDDRKPFYVSRILQFLSKIELVRI